MEIKQVEIEKWEQLSNHAVAPSIVYKADYVELISMSFQVKPLAWVVFNAQKPVLGLQTFAKGRKLVHPSTYLYTSIWTSGPAQTCQKALLCLLDKLTHQYKFIHFLFSPDVVDIRPFLRSGFKASVKYTLLKSLKDLSFSSKLKSRENRAYSEGITLHWDDQNNDVIEQYRRDFVNYGFSRQYSQQMEMFIVQLLSKGYGKAMKARKGEKLIASGVVLTDYLRKHTMNLLISSEKKFHQTGVHTALYLQIFRQLQKDGFLSNDLFGANTFGIGNFKSSFGNELMPHYELKYNNLRRTLVMGYLTLQRILGKLLR